MQVFNAVEFDVSFKKTIAQLAKAEKITKEVLKELSRDVLVAVHSSGDIAYYNRMLDVLTPVNKRAAIVYGKEFLGFSYDDETKSFGKKSKKQYDAVLAKVEEFLADPHNNIWSWQERHLEIEAKPLDLTKITAFIKSALKKADEQGIKQSDVMSAVFAAGVDVDALIVAMQAMQENVNA